MAARLFVPSMGSPAERVAQEDSEEVFRIDVRPYKARLVSNSFNHADELDLTLSYDEAGIDPRYLKSAVVYFYLADAALDAFTIGPDSLRFIGIARNVERIFDESKGKSITLKVHDYTSLFLEAKNFPDSGKPLFSDTLQKAWERICDHTGYWDLSGEKPVINSTVQALRSQLRFIGDIDREKTLGATVPARLASLGTLDTKHTADAWAVWQAAVSALGLISFIRNDRCVVTQASDFYTADIAPRFVWGKNILSLTECRELGQVSASNVVARSYDPLAGHILEGYYPPLNQSLRQRKKMTASTGHARHATPKSVKTQDYEPFDLPFAVASQEAIDHCAKRIWDERVRQELHGKLKTREMSVTTTDPTARFELLELQSGDQIQIEIDREALDSIQRLETVGAKITALRGKGYEEDIAAFMAKNIDSIVKMPALFLVHSVTTEVESGGASGGCSFNLEIDFLNRVDISEDGLALLGAGTVTNASAGKHEPPIEGQVPTEPLPNNFEGVSEGA